MELSVRHFFVEWVKQHEFNEKDRVALKVIIKELLVSKTVDIYHLHEKYHVDPFSMNNALKVLSEFELINILDEHISLKDGYNMTEISILNYIMRTSRPSFLNGNLDWLTNHYD